MRNYITTRINELHLHTNRLSKSCIMYNFILHKYKTRQSQSTQDVRLVVTLGARVWLEEGKRGASGMCNLLFLIWMSVAWVCVVCSLLHVYHASIESSKGINSRGIGELNVKDKTTEPLVDNTEKHFGDEGRYLKQDTHVHAHTHKLNYVKIRNFWSLNNTFSLTVKRSVSRKPFLGPRPT